MNNYLKKHILYGGDYNPDQWPVGEIDILSTSSTEAEYDIKLNPKLMRYVDL